VTGPGRTRQQAIYTDGVAGARPPVPSDGAALEAAARRVLDDDAFAYLAGGAGGEHTQRANRDAFARWRFVPRVLRDTATRSLGITLFGRVLPTPLLLAPIGVLELAHHEGDRAVARAAAAAGVPMVFSNQASVPMESCAAVMGDAPRWFQLYWNTSDAVVESFVRRAEGCGCGAIVLTVDTTALGWRPRDLDRGSLPFLRGMGLAQYLSDPVFRRECAEAPPISGARPPRTLSTVGAALAQRRRGASPVAVQRFLSTYSRSSLTWHDLAHLRALTALPLVLKGILHPDDARRALDAGADAVVVSNHGGRQVDRAIAALDALPGVVAAVAGRAPVLFDSGVRSGADVAVALAVGAAAVLLGRPYAYGLALAGAAGVRAVVANVLAELDLTVALTGAGSLAGLREVIAPA
jgi:isopentenyl diphosphate isomerase/L-lactate dehydrogenase-like FMN-dependent dehydrogenase